MKRSCFWIAFATLMVGVTPPASAQLAISAWPKQFGGNANHSRSTLVNGPVGQLQLAHELGLSGPFNDLNDPTVGPGGIIYVTKKGEADGVSTTWLHALQVTAANQLQSVWSVNLSPVASRVSAATIDTRGYAFMGARAPDNMGSEPRLVRVNLTTQAVDWVTVAGNMQTAHHQAPSIDSQGTVFVATDSSVSSGGAAVWAVDGSTMLVRHVWRMNQTPFSNNNGVLFFRYALQVDNPVGVHYLYLHGTWFNFGSFNHRVTKLQYTIAGGFSPVFNFDTPVGNSPPMWPATFPSLSTMGDYFYITRYVGNFPGQVYLEARSRATGTVSSFNTLDTTSNGTENVPIAVAVETAGQVFAPSATTRLFNWTLGLVNSWNVSSVNPPALDVDQNTWLVLNDGSIWVKSWTGLTYLTPAQAKGQVAILDPGHLVVRHGQGIGLFIP